MSTSAPPATVTVPLISGRLSGVLGIGHLPRLWLKLRLNAIGRLPEGYRCGEGGSDGQIIEATGVDKDALLAFVTANAPDYIDFEAWFRVNAKTTSSPELDEVNSGFETFVMPDPRRSEWTARFGLPAYTIATRLNELDDWDLVHAQIVANASRELIVPAISSKTTGPLGVAHLPRVWLKILLHAVGRLPEEYRHGFGGFDEMTEEDLGIDQAAFVAYVEAEKPGYLQLEAWVRANATNLTPESIVAHNAKLLAHEVPPDRAAPRRVALRIPDSVKTGAEMNNYDDWLQLHQQMLAQR